jgi:hypothetical protein
MVNYDSFGSALLALKVSPIACISTKLALSWTNVL